MCCKLYIYHKKFYLSLKCLQKIYLIYHNLYICKLEWFAIVAIPNEKKYKT